MCDKADETAWSKVLSDDEPSGEKNRPTSADVLTPAVSSGTQAMVESGADDLKRITEAQSEQIRAGVSETIYTAQEKLPPERLMREAQERVGDFPAHTEEKPIGAIPETTEAAEVVMSTLR